MKQINFLSSLGSQSMGLRVTTLALTVGSPSAHRRSTMLKLLSVLVLVLTFGVGQMWGATETLTMSSMGWSNQTVQSSITATSATIALAKNSAGTAPTYYTSDGLRMYGIKNNTTGCSIAFTAKSGYTITGITFTHTSTNSGVLSASTGTYSNKAWTGTLSAGSTVTFKTTNTGNQSNNPQVRITQIVITYSVATPATISLNPEGGTCTQSSLTEAAAGAGVTLPNASPSSSCAGQDWTFAGWAKAAITETTTAPTLYTGNYTPVNGETLHAVYKKTVSSGGSSSGSRTFAFSSIASTNNWEKGEAYTEVELAPVTIEAQGGGNNGKWYTSSGGSWRAYSGGTISISVENGSVTSVTSSPSCSFTVSNGTASFSPSARTDFTSITVNYTATGASITTYNSNPNCCTNLGQINGSVSVTNQTVSWNAVTDASGYKVKVDNGDWTDIGNVLSYTPTLACGSGNHNVYVKAYNTNNSGHCTGDGPESAALVVASAACTEPEITASPTSLSNLNYIVGQGASATQSFSINGTNLTSGTLTVTAPANFEVSKASGSGWASSITFTGVSGTLAATTVYVRLASSKSAGEYSGNVAITGCGLASAVNVGVSGSVLQPTITATPTSISDWSTQTGSAPSPATKTITVTGSNLKADISAALTAGGDYFTITPSGLAQSEGSVNGSVVIGVKAAAYASAATREGTLRLSTTDGDNVDVTFSLTVTDDPREKFTLLTSSNLSEIGDGTRIVIVEADRDYAMNRTQDGTNGHGYIGSTNQFSFQSENTIITLEVSNSVEILTLEEISAGVYALKTESTSKYLKWGGGTNNKFSEETTYDEANAKWTISVDKDGYAQICANSGSGRYIGYNSGATTSKFRAYSDNSSYPIYAYFKASTTPKVNISGTLDAFTYMRDNGPSAAQLFKVRGNNLSENLVVTAPTNYEVCKTENGTYEASVAFTPSEGSVAESNVYIRLKSGLAINTYNGDITVSSTGATNATLAVAGSVTTPVYTVTLYTNGGTINAGNITSYTEGVGATLPTNVTKDGFSFDGWFANEGLTGSAVTTIATNATGAKEYWAGWTELPGYDVVWYVDGEPYTAGDPTTHVVYNGSISKLPKAPTSLDITSKTFVGWTTSPVTEKQNAAPSPLYTAADQIPGSIQAKQEFYAVFAQETYSGTFTKVTNDATLAAGDRLLFVYESGNKAAGGFGSGNFLTSQDVTISNSTISSQGNAVVYVLGGTSGKWTFTSNAGTLECTGTSNGSLALSGGDDKWSISIDGNATICNSAYDDNTYIRYNSSSPRFTTYKSGQQPVQLYREGTSLNNYTTKFVKPIAVTGVTLNKNATTLAINGSETLTAIVAPANAHNKNVSWTTSAPGVATVEAGVVTAVADGEATITVTTEDGEFTDACVVTVLPTVATPTFSPAAGAINKGSKVEILCATEDATILYSLDGSDPSVAYPEGGVTINANCTLKAKATKANYTTSAVAQAAYTIIKASQTVSFAESAISFRLESDEYDAFTGQVASSTYDGASITYASSNTSVAEVDTNTGVVTLKGVKGTTTITATAAEDEDYQSASATYTITVLRAGKTRTGDFVLVTNANQLEDGDYILLTSETRNGYENPDYASVFSGITSSAGTFQNKNVANEEITYAQLLKEGNTAKIIYLEKVTVGNIDYWAFNYGTESDIYIAALTNSSNGLNSEGSTSDYSLWSISIGANNVANVTNKGNSGHGVLSYNTQGSGAFKAYTQLQSGSLRIYKQKDKNKLPQTLSFATASYEFPLNESAYTSFSHQTVSGAQTAVTYTSSNAEVAAIVENTVVLQGGVGTTTITATAAEDDDYEHASATYTITVTAALNTVTFHYYKAADATADQTALKEASSGAGISVPANPANVGEYTFLGWAPATLDETQTAPELVALQAEDTYHPTTDKDFYAIYRRIENSDGRFYLMHNNNYAKAPVGDEFGNTTDITQAAKFVQTEDNKLYYYNGSTPTYIAGTHNGSGSDGRALDFTTNEADALVWTITESGQTVSYYDGNTEKYFAHNNTMWAAYASSSINQANQSKDLTKVYLANVYYSSTPNLMVSPVLTWAQGNATHVMEIEETYDNAATATVGGEPVSVSYSSSDPEKATVSNAGVVTAIKGGLVTITATVAENPGVSRALVETYQVSITKKVPQITFAASTEGDYKYKVFVGEAYKKDLSENVTIVSDGAVSYSLSNNATSSEYASINASTGVVTGLSSNGSAIQYMFVRTAETDMYQPGEANHIFYVLSLKNQALAFDQNAYVFDMNESVDVFTNTLSGVQTSATFASNNTDVAEVDAASGEVTVHTNVCGTATITATAAEGQVGDEVYKEVSQAYTITVNYPMPTFSMESSEIKAPVSLAISGYDENTKLYWTDGNEDPETQYSEPLAIDDTKTIRAKATSADGSLVSPIASVTLTKVTPTVVGSQEGGTITLSSDANSLITYIIENGNHVIVASGEDVPAPVVFETEMSDTYSVVAQAAWNVEGGFSGSEYEHDFVVKAKGHLPISYTGNGTNGIDNEPWATKIGNVSNYNGGDIKFDGSELALIAAFVEKPIQLSYSIKHNPSESKAWTATENVYKVQWSADGETYTDIKVYDSSTPITTAVINETFNLDASARYIKWIYVTKDSNKGGNVALNNIRITCEAVVIDGVSVVDIPEGYDGDVVVENGVTWEPEENEVTEIHNLLIKQGAIVDVTAAGLVVNDVILESMEGYSGQILDPDYCSVNGNAYYDLTLNTSGTMDNSKWYAFAVPFQVDAATGIQRLSNDGKTSNAGFNSHYRIKKYDSARRLSTGKGWVDVTSGETLYPGHFYMISLNSNVYNRLRMTKKAGTNLSNIGDITLVTNGESNNYNANWNALANNALAYVNVSASGANSGLKVQVYNSATNNYTPYAYNKVTFTVGTPFFLQAAAEGTMSVNIAASNNETVKAPAREAVATEEFEVRLGTDTESYYDILYVSASDEALNEYQIGHDLQKAGVSTTVPQMYVPAYNTKLCDAEFPLVNNEATFPLTFTIPTAGTYQLYLADAPENANLYLQKNGVTVWDMTAGAYALEIESGTNTDYSLLLKIKENTMTGVDQINAKAGVQKVVIDEHVYILRGGQMYDMTGKMVK